MKNKSLIWRLSGDGSPDRVILILDPGLNDSSAANAAAVIAQAISVPPPVVVAVPAATIAGGKVLEIDCQGIPIDFIPNVVNNREFCILIFFY